MMHMPAKKKFPTETTSDLNEKPEDQGEGVYDETEDIYDDKQREEMLQDDEISVAENAFIEGSEMAMGDGAKKKIKKVLSSQHDDTPSTELTEREPPD
jgi:hypothetical protein